MYIERGEKGRGGYKGRRVRERREERKEGGRREGGREGEREREKKRKERQSGETGNGSDELSTQNTEVE